MAHVVDLSAPNARLVVAQGTPDNKVINLINESCGPLAGEPVDHQGYFLIVAVQIFTQGGFGQINVDVVEASCNFPEQDMAAKCARAAEVLQNLRYHGHTQADAMRATMIPALERHFGVVLVLYVTILSS